MRHNTIGLIWGGGLLLAVLVYVAGPDHFVTSLMLLLDRVAERLDLMIRRMSLAGFDVLRSVTIALFAVFVILAILAAQRGLRARRALVAVSVLFLLLVGSGEASGPRWVAALALAAVGALKMTRRLRHYSVPPPVTFRN